MDESSSNLTVLMARAEQGDANAASEMLELVYEELRRMAAFLMNREMPGQTLQATALVHEAYIRLIGSDQSGWKDSQHFFNAAALVMRRCLIDRAKRKSRVRHGGDAERVPMDLIDIPASEIFEVEDLEIVEKSLKHLAAHNTRWSEVIDLRLFLGFTIEQTAEAMDISIATVKTDYRFALAWLRAQILKHRGDEHPP